MQICQIEPGDALLAGVGLLTKDCAAFFVSCHHKIVERESVNTLWSYPPFVQSQIRAGGSVIGFDIIFHDGLQVLKQELMNFGIVGHPVPPEDL